MADNKSLIWALLPAAGQGRRAGTGIPKQYHKLGHKTVICHTLDRLLAVDGLSGLAVGIAADDQYWQAVCPQHPLLFNTFIGGAERADTVLRGLAYLREQGAGKDDWVLVHDAVRPCVRVADIHRLMQALEAEGADGGLLAAPLSDTLKQVGAKNEVVRTISRSRLWRAFTPQCFRLGSLESALLAADVQLTKPTDEAEAMEWAGKIPLLVQGHTDNIKITFAQDLALAEQLLRLQREQ